MALTLSTDLVLPVELTGYIRQALADYNQNRFTLSRFLPDQTIDDIEYRVMTGQLGLADAAEYRTYDAESPIAGRPGVSRMSGEIPPISRKKRLGEYDRLRLRGGDNVRDELRTIIFNDAAQLTQGIAARIEMARADALLNGSVTINENGVKGVTVNFGRPSGNTVTAGTLWSTVATADPIGDILTWSDYYLSVNGVRPARMVFSTQVLRYLLANKNITTLAGTILGVPNRVSQATLQNVFDNEGLPTYEINDAMVNVNGTPTRIIPANKVLLLPAPAASPSESQLGTTLWGTTAESLLPDYGIEDGQYPGIVGAQYSDNDPVAQWTKCAAIALPVMPNPSLSMTATVA
jgi:hypothetical protein